MSLPTDTTTAPASPGAFARYRGATFSSLGTRNYRLYFVGQGISLVGTWMQMFAQSWLVLQLTGSGALLGVVTALQFLPVLALAPYGGLLADRFPKRRILFVTQACAAVLALTLGVLVVTGLLRVWMLFVLAVATGLINALDNPTRQSFIHELVGAREIKNAVTLNSLEVNLSRIIGPAIAGVFIARVGFPPCFFLNAASFSAVLVCLWLMRDSELEHTARVRARKGQLADGFRYVLRAPVLLVVLVMMAVVGTLTYEFQVSLPMLARFTFHGDAGSAALLTCSMGVGAVLGALVVAGRGAATVARLTLVSFAFGVTTLLVALAPSLVLAAVGMALVGACSISFTSLTNTLLQLEAEPTMRGRVMSLWTMAFLGSTLIGAPIIGLVGQHFDPRWCLVVGGVAALAAGVVGLVLGAAARLHPAGATVQVPAIAEKEDYV